MATDPEGRATELVFELIRQLDAENIKHTYAVPAMIDVAITIAHMDGGRKAGDEVLERVRLRMWDWPGLKASIDRRAERERALIVPVKRQFPETRHRDSQTEGPSAVR